MKLTIEPSVREGDHVHPRVIIETPHDHMTMDTLITDLVRPALLALGFAERTVNEALDIEE